MNNMQIKEILLEMPYRHPGEMVVTKYLAGDYSNEAIKREFKVITTFDVKGHTLTVLMMRSKDMIMVIEYISSSSRQMPLFKLAFKENCELNIIPDVIKSFPILQVDSVSMHSEYRHAGIASSIYKLLADIGYAIVSDNSQFDPGAALWSKLAKDPSYTVIVTDIDYGPFKDADGEIIKYNGANIADNEIWSSGSDMDGANRLLVLFKS